MFWIRSPLAMSSRSASRRVHGATRLAVSCFRLWGFAGAARLAFAVGDPAAAESAPPTDAPGGTPASVLTRISGEVASVFAKCKDAVVRIQAVDRYGPHAGTGFFVDPNGTIYTDYAADPRSGVTLLKIEAAATPFLPICRTNDLKVASPVITIGYPLDLPESPEFGLIAGFDEKILNHFLTTTHIRANVPVQSGEQGAPMLNVKGEVVGILVCRLDYGAACLGLPIRAAEKVRGDYMRFGEPRPGWVGVTVVPDTAGDSAELRVAELAEDTPVFRCGMRVGDILLQVGKVPIRHLGDLGDASFYLTADEIVPITVRRGDKQLTFDVRAARPPGTTVTAAPTHASEGMRLMLPGVP